MTNKKKKNKNKKNTVYMFNVGDVVALNLNSGSTIIGVLGNETGETTVIVNPLEMIKRTLLDTRGNGYSFAKHAMLNNDLATPVSFNPASILSMYAVDDEMCEVYDNLNVMYSKISTKMDLLGISGFDENDEESMSSIKKAFNRNSISKLDENAKIDINDLRKSTLRLNEDESDYDVIDEFDDEDTKD